MSKRIHTDWDHIIDPEHEVIKLLAESDDECVDNRISGKISLQTYLQRSEEYKIVGDYKMRCPTNKRQTFRETAVRAMQRTRYCSFRKTGKKLKAKLLLLI